MADITPGYTFASGEKNVTHTKLNTATAGTVNTTFHTGKASVAANPNTGSTEVMVYDSSATVFKKGTLAALVFDHTGLLSSRTAKTVPVSADALLLADSAAAGAYKQITLSNLLFGAAAHTAPIESDKLAIYDATGSLTKTITVGNLVTQATALSSMDGLERILVMTNAGALRKMRLADLASQATAVTALAGVDNIPIVQGGTLKRVLVGDLVEAQTAMTSPAGGENLLITNGTATARRITSSNLKLYSQKGYALYRDERGSGVAYGAITAGSWQLRTLNTESVDNTAAGASLAASQVTLAAGTYRFRGRAPFWRVGAAQLRLFNATDAAVVAIGMTVNSANSVNTAVAVSEVTGRFTIAGAKAFQLEHQITASVGTSDGGAPGGFGTEVYGTLEFWQED